MTQLWNVERVFPHSTKKMYTKTQLRDKHQKLIQYKYTQKSCARFFLCLYIFLKIFDKYSNTIFEQVFFSFLQNITIIVIVKKSISSLKPLLSLKEGRQFGW